MAKIQLLDDKELLEQVILRLAGVDGLSYTFKELEAIHPKKIKRLTIRAYSVIAYFQIYLSSKKII